MHIVYSLLALIFIAAGTTAAADNGTARVERVLSQEEQAALTPDDVLASLKQGNQRFLSGTVTSRDHSAQVRSAASGLIGTAWSGLSRETSWVRSPSSRTSVR